MQARSSSVMDMGHIENISSNIQAGTMRKKARSRVGNYQNTNNVQANVNASSLLQNEAIRLKHNSSVAHLLLTERNKSLGASPESHNRTQEKSQLSIKRNIKGQVPGSTHTQVPPNLIKAG